MTKETQTIEKYCEIISKEIINRNFISFDEINPMITTNILLCITEVSKDKIKEFNRDLVQTKIRLKSINQDVGGNSQTLQKKSTELRTNLKQNVNLFNATREELKRIYLRKWLFENHPELLEDFYIEFDKNELFDQPEYNKNDLRLKRSHSK